MNAMTPPELDPDPAYALSRPETPRPIVILGAGGIVRDAHLPAYRAAAYPVWGIVNRTLTRAQDLARQYGIENVFGSVAEAVAKAPPEAIYDLAMMPEQYAEALAALPDRSAVLIQKPLGQNLTDALDLRDICRRKSLIAAVNTQLRFAPYVAEARRLIAAGTIGELIDVEIRVCVDTPWQMFPNVLGLPRLELNAHSVHYIDLVRSFLGDPEGVSAVTVPHPLKPEIANTRSAILMRYPGRPVRVTITTNHDHIYGHRFEESFIKWEGTKGAIRAQMGLLLDYPQGGPDSLHMALSDRRDAGWEEVAFDGSWFPDAFAASMGVLHRYVEGSTHSLPTSVDDVVKTMAVIDAAHESADGKGVSIPTGDRFGTGAA